jgi:hypothetical protein
MDTNELCGLINTSTSAQSVKKYALDELLKNFMKNKGWWLLFFAVFLSFADCLWLFL